MTSKGDVIQVNERYADKAWVGCLMIVTEVAVWGVQAYIHIPRQGDAYLRLGHLAYDVIGKAALVHSDDC